MMNWLEETNFDVEKKQGKLSVTLSVNHTRGTRNYQNKTYTTDFIVNYLNNNKIIFDEVLQETIVYNYQTQDRCIGTWVFSLPKTTKAKKTTQPIENKETVIKMNSKKTTKK